MSQTGQKILSVRDLSVSFVINGVEQNVTHDINFDIAAGETIALVGESGSGKSVTAMALLRLLPHNARAKGSVRFKGRELTTLTERDLDKIRRDDIGVVFQDVMSSLNPVYTIGQMMSHVLRSEKLSKRALHERLPRILDC
jgi:peptide/nickel transport system ATP-binding protein